MDNLGKIKKEFGKKIKNINKVNDKRIYIEIDTDFLKDAVEFLFNKMNMRFATASGVDEIDHMEIVYHFSMDKTGEIYSLVVSFDRKSPKVDTITDIVTGAKWIERELNELLGIEFEGNSDMRHLILSDDYEGRKFPLRKNV